MTASHLLLFDSSGFAYRAHYAMRPLARKSDGMPIHAITGFMSIVYRTLERAAADPYTHAAAVFDAPGKTFRHKIFPSYKSGRKRPEGLTVQLPLLRQAADVLGLEAVEADGYEADDVIATLATRAKAQGMRTTIVTVDKDYGQLVEDGVIEIADPVKRIHLYAKDVEEMFGVPPALVTDAQALMGDPTDTIPGIPGVGPKTAAELIRRFGDLNGVLAAIDAGNSKGTRAELWRKLTRARKDLPIYRNLVTLRRDVPLDVTFDALVPRPIVEQYLRDILDGLEAGHMFDNLFGRDPKLFRTVEPMFDPLQWWRTELKGPSGREPIPDEPQPGWYKRRLVQGGHWVACRIWHEPEYDMDKLTGKHMLCCEVAGTRVDALSHWTYLAFQPISEAEYRTMMDLAQAFKEHSPNSSLANPTKPINWNEEPL